MVDLEQKPTIKVIIFDLGSVVYTTDWNGLNENFRSKFGFDIRPFKSESMGVLKEKIIGIFKDAIVGRTCIRDAVICLGKKENAEEIISYYKQYYAKNKVLNLHMVAIINKLKRGYSVFALTDTNKEHYEADEESGLFDLFDDVFASHILGKRKTDITIFHDLVQKIGFKPEECLFIDDIEEHIENARKVGMKAIHYTDFPNMDKFVEELNSMLKISLTLRKI